MIRPPLNAKQEVDLKEKSCKEEAGVLQMLVSMLQQYMRGKSQNEERLKKDVVSKQKIGDQRVDKVEGQGQIRTRVILFTNKHKLFKAQHGLEFEAGLDARDKVLSHVFSYEMTIQTSIESTKFQDTSYFQRLCEQITSYLVDVVENVLSITFKNLTEGKLTDKEAKDYSSKNILLNVHSIQTCIMDTLLQEQLINADEKMDIFFQFAQLINNSLKESIGIQSVYFPQAPPTGASPRMRENIIPLNRIINQQFDFLYTQGIKLERQPDGDYTGFIMKVMNRSIESTVQVDESSTSLYQTMYEKFVHFSENLFWLAQQESYHEILQSIEEQKSKYKGECEKKKAQSKPQTRKKITSEQKLHSDSSKTIKSVIEQEIKLYVREEKDIKVESKTHQLSEYFSQDFYTEKGKDKSKSKIGDKLSDHGSERRDKELFSEKWKEKSHFKSKQAQIMEMRQHHVFLIGKKITNAQAFTKKDIKDHNLSTKNSSILRLLTKWATCLEEIFKNPQQFTKDRLYPFKSSNNTSILLKQKEKIELCNNIKAQRKEMESINKELIMKYRVFQGMFLCQNQRDLSQYVKRFTEARVISSKMNALLTKFMCQYLSSLINLLVKAGKIKKLAQKCDGELSETSIFVNLVIFPIGDLMRSKINCDEMSFIRLLKTLYYLDEADRRERPFFQLVNIKNKLDTKDNNILINYLFMGKLQVELQMSVQQIKGKQEHYYNFNHFLYELKRGKFGILAECATVVSQYDPIVSSSTDDYYEPKLKKTSIQKGFNYQIFNKDERDKSFVCNQCQKLIISENMFFLKRKNDKNVCNKCVLSQNEHSSEGKVSKEISQNQHYPECVLAETTQRQLIQRHIANKQMKKLMNYQQFQKDKQNTQFFLVVNLNSKLDVFDVSIVGRLQQADQWFSSVINCSEFEEFDIDKMKISYEDITASIKSNKKSAQFSYIIDGEQKFNVLGELMACQEMSVTNENLSLLGKKIKQTMIKDNILRSLKGKNQTLSFNEDKSKFKAIQEIMKRKSNQDSLSSIEYLSAYAIQQEQIPQWIKGCQKLKSLNFNYNKISSIKNIRLSTSFRNIQEIMLNNNMLTEMIITKGYYLASLESVHIRQNKIKQLVLIDLPRLKYLNASYNEGLVSNIKLTNLKSLKTLVLVDIKHEDPSLKKYNQLKVEDLPSLSTLNLYNNGLISLTIKNCDNLKVLTLSCNQLPSFKQIFTSDGKHAINTKELKLTELNLSHNRDMQIQLHSLPSTLKDLNLQSIHIKKQLKFSELSKNLQKINVSYNPDMKIDFDLKEMSSIKEMDVSCCSLRSINLQKYQKMEKLNLEGNQIIELQLGHMPLLKELNLIKNQLGESTIYFPRNLEILKFQQNKIVSLDKFTFSSGLKELHLGKNLISDLSTFSFPSGLQTLNLSQNCLQKLQIQNMQYLESLVLDSQASNKTSKKLKELCVIGCPKIERISSKYQNLEVLILKQLPKLKQINLGKITLTKIQLVNIGKEPKFQCSDTAFKTIHQVYPNAIYFR